MQQWIIGINLAELQDRIITQSEIIKSYTCSERESICVCVHGVTHQPGRSCHREKGKVECKGENHLLFMALWYYLLIKIPAAQLSWDRQTKTRNLRINYLWSFSWGGSGICMFLLQADQSFCYCSYESVVLSKMFWSARQPWETAFLKQKYFPSLTFPA